MLSAKIGHYTRMDNIILQMMQAGLIFKSRSDFLQEVRRERYRKIEMKKGFKVMLLKQLAFGFYFLITRYIRATIVFIIELIVDRSASKSENQIGIKKSMGKKQKIEVNDKIPKTLA